MRQPARTLDLRSASFKNDPIPTWQRLHALGAIVTSRQNLLGRIAFATTHRAAQSVLKDESRFTVDARGIGERRASGLRWWVPSGYQQLADSMLTHDGAEHTRLRRAVDHAFRRSALEPLQDVIDTMAAERVHAMGSQRDVDWVVSVARPLPRDVISDILGFNHRFSTDRAVFDKALTRLGSIQGAFDLFRVVPALNRIKYALRAEIIARRQQATDDLLGRLAHTATDSDVSLTESELLSIAFLLYVAGQETTTHLLSTALLAILRDSDVRDALPIPVTRPAVMELLRHTGPVQFSKPRFVTEDLQLEDVELRRGDTISAMVAAAGHDPAWTDRPEWVDFERRVRAPLGFGSGAHHCLGQQLALAETASALTALFVRYPDVRLSNPQQLPDWTRRLGLRALNRLALRLY